MILFDKFSLDNGLTVLVHHDPTTPVAAVNIAYNVGARDEDPARTGFAHLFEHLMFGGSENIPQYDEPLQQAGGDNNAFTNNDLTNFYLTLPLQNLEVAFWLESDRMNALRFSKKSLEVQRKVVLEEFSETTLNTPYGDVWHELMGLCYTVHPYRWPTIGLVPAHVAEATLDDVRSFFFRYYRPNNAVLVVAGNVTTEAVRVLAQKWFGPIPAGDVPLRNLPQEPLPIERRFQEKIAKVPVDALYLAFPMPARLDPEYYAADLLSDVLSDGSSSRLYRELVKERRIFAEIDAYVTGSLDPGLFIIEGKPADGVTLEQAEAAVWAIIDALKADGVTERELQKIKNKVETNLVFTEMGVLQKAMNLAMYELLGDANLINTEAERYANMSVDDILRAANNLLTTDRAAALYYRAEEPQPNFALATDDDDEESEVKW